MSSYANPSLAFLALDGDAFRAPAGTPVPPDIFAPSLSGWVPYGGIKAGFTKQVEQQITDLYVWNKREAPYRRKKDAKKPKILFRAVDQGPASALTVLRGGSISAGNGGHEWIEGDEEFFAFIFRVEDGDEAKAFYAQKAEAGPPPEEKYDGEDLDGWDFDLSPLIPDDGSKPLRRWTKSNPFA
ncbi:hypothetical protein [Actinosynnema mirum]|uniref:Uncharacterized protein n=1 Tax=Actinosynnema mirum (strain ATCC 29888 / DSM 43827 / JCM 3225 / NBRC 14064 / NCIMB 13271 / NRRL B-12336 / IMRU 3971 / 101) TaxID=446462 RepID=C6WC60_ACTMD|nr:hypothetical protein [Actinosynnema mirum]ACU39448.1 hypothetical protein Amir_5632 [Actinosynnema mirum DSM 43827]